MNGIGNWNFHYARVVTFALATALGGHCAFAQVQASKGDASPEARVVMSDERVAIDGVFWESQSASKPYSLAISRDDYRFEVRGKDHAGFDPPRGKERSELSGAALRIAPGKRFTAEFDLLVEAGPVTDRAWFLVFQVQPDDVPDQFASPLFALDIQANADRSGEDLVVIGATSPRKPPHAWATLRNFARAPFTRAQVHHVKIAVIDNNGVDTEPFLPPFSEARGHFGYRGDFGVGTGLCHVEFDGKTIADFKGVPMGYGFEVGSRGAYPKFGIFAHEATQLSDTGLVVHVTSPKFHVEP